MVRGVNETYARVSGQLINMSKSSCCFSRNVNVKQKNIICGILGVEEKEDLENYLGLPTRVGLNKKEILGFIKYRLVQRLNSWKYRYLSRAGKEVILKTVLQALPNYVMNLFLLPKTFCNELH